MQLAIHCRGIGPALGVEVHLALPGHVQEIHHHHAQGQIFFAIFIGNIEKLILRRIDCFALDIAVNRARQHVRYAGEQAIALVDFVAGIAGDHEVRNAVADLRRPDVALIEAEVDGGL